MKVKIDIPKAAIMQNQRNEALEVAIKALERSTGHWINYNTPCFSECSECSHPFDWADNCMEDWQYCPNCGAKMDSEVKA